MFSFIPSPYLLAAKLSLGLAVVGGAFTLGHHAATVQEKAKQLDIEVAFQKAYSLQAANYQTIAIQYEELKNARVQANKANQKRVEQVVIRPLYDKQCMDDDGVFIANQALTGRSPAASQPDATLPQSHRP